ncbi:MAG: hypothetical protein Q9222_004026 [Ikaeria aurantiellina]
MSSLGFDSPLQTLILLQGIQASDKTAVPFDTLSASLKASTSTSKSKVFNTERFEPKTLELLYLRLLKEEVKLQGQQHERSDQDHDGEPRTGDQRLSSPQLETMEEAIQYSHLIPKVATRVYDNHRDSATMAIREEENKYNILEKDVQAIERGEWDDRLQNERSTRRDSKGPASIQTLLRDEPAPSSSLSGPTNGQIINPLPSVNEKPSRQTSPPKAQVVSNQSPVPQYTNGVSDNQVSGGADSIPQKNAPVPVSPRRARQPGFSPNLVPSNASRPPSQSGPTDKNVPFLPPPPLAGHQNYTGASPPPDNHRRQTSQPANIAPSPGIRPHQPPLPHPERSSGSPIILPPPPGMLRTTSSPSRPLDALADMAGQSYRPNAMPSPRPLHPSNGAQHQVQLPLPPNYAHKQYQYPAYDNRQPYPNAYSPYHPGHSPPFHSQNQHIPPYQHAPPNVGQYSHYPPRSSYHSPVPPYPQYSPYGTPTAYPPHGTTASPYAPYPPPPPRILEQQASFHTPEARVRPPKPSPIITSASSTKWKKADAKETPRSPKSPTRPRSEEWSPISDKIESPMLPPAKTLDTARGSRTKVPLSATEADTVSLPQPPRTKRGRGRPPRSIATRGRSTRAASTTSSARRTHTRSASAASGTDELSHEPPASSTRRLAIKPEPPATPARDSSASVPPTATTDNEGNRKSTRQRRETFRGMELAAESTRTTMTKRKRTIEADPETRPAVGSAFEKQKSELSATHILASRNFPRTSATLMNDITAHKLASIFAKPITEREAPGYHSLIYRPQDLKSIKQAITNGNRALTAFIDQDREDNEEETGGGEAGDVIPVAGAGEADTRVWVRRTNNDDFVPPKGIVNSAQLEKEIVRVFANAVMFNPDPRRDLGPAFRTRGKKVGRERHVPLSMLSENADGGGDGDDERRGEGGEDDDDDDDDGDEEEGGVVRDAREMFEDVERVVAEWRAAERAAEEAAAVTSAGIKRGEEEEADELAGEDSTIIGEEEGVGERAVKRRRR